MAVFPQHPRLEGTVVTLNDIQATLRLLRQQAASAPESVGSHQLHAHWSLAYACGEAAEPSEMYRAPGLQLMPCTEFYVGHASEIEVALKREATHSLLKEYGDEKRALEARFTDEERSEYHSFSN